MCQQDKILILYTFDVLLNTTFIMGQAVAEKNVRRVTGWKHISFNFGEWRSGDNSIYEGGGLSEKL